MQSFVEILQHRFIKKRDRHRCYPVKFAKCFEETFFYRTHLTAASDNEHIVNYEVLIIGLVELPKQRHVINFYSRSSHFVLYLTFFTISIKMKNTMTMS